jgi:hypothetical protein
MHPDTLCGPAKAPPTSRPTYIYDRSAPHGPVEGTLINLGSFKVAFARRLLEDTNERRVGSHRDVTPNQLRWWLSRW